jgi:hypothetical protein
VIACRRSSREENHQTENRFREEVGAEINAPGPAPDCIQALIGHADAFQTHARKRR